MRIFLLICIASALLIFMFVRLEHGDATKERILTKEQESKLKNVMKPPRL